MEESFILNDINGENKRKLGKKEKKYIEKKAKEKEKEKNIKRIKEEKKIKEKKKEKIKEEKEEKKEKVNKNIKIPKLFNKNLKSKRNGKRNNKIDYSEENSEENSKINIINTSKDEFDIINNNNINKESKPRSTKLRLNITKENNQNDNFENNIIKAYEKLSEFYKNKNNNKKDIVYNPELISRLKLTEKKLRNALNILKQDKNIIINRNIMDKLSRLTEHDKININYVIGSIYMLLMKRGNIFNYKNKNFEINDLVFFTNKVIQFKDILYN